MYNFPMPTETLRAELAEARGIVFDLDDELTGAKAKIDAALRLHKPSDTMDSWGNRMCEECTVSTHYQEYPCPTALALGVAD
jgi:hypothetical protein